MKGRKSIRCCKRFLAILVIAAFLLPGFPVDVKASGTATYPVSGTFDNGGSRDSLSLINAFRTGSDAWYWASNDTDKVVCSNLQPLKYDYNLEQIALQRALEISLRFAHTRPNGTSCFTATYNGVSSSGENIAIGYNSYTTAAAAFNGWREDNDKYAGQGHRRNMLNANFTSVGVAHVVIGNIHCHVQEFGYTNGGGSAAAGGTVTKQIEVKSSDLKLVADFSGYSDVQVYYGGSTDIPAARLSLRLNDTWGPCPGISISSSEAQVSYSIADPSIASISGTRVTGKKAGQTNLTATFTYNGQTKTATLPVKVLKIDFSKLEFSPLGDMVYTGSPIVFSLPLNVNGQDLTEGKDYTVAFSNNTGPGTATVTITGIGENCNGTKKLTFKIVNNGGVTPQPTVTPKPTSTPQPTATPKPTSTPKPTATPKPTSTPKPTATPKPTSAQGATPTPKLTPTPKQTPTPKPTPTPTPKPADPTPVPSAEPTPTPAEATPTPNEGITPTPKDNVTPTPDTNVTPAGEPSPTEDPSLTEEPNPTDTPEPSDAAEPEITVTVGAEDLPETGDTMLPPVGAELNPHLPISIIQVPGMNLPTEGAESYDPGRIPSESEKQDEGGSHKGIAWIILVPIGLLGVWAVVINIGRKR